MTKKTSDKSSRTPFRSRVFTAFAIVLKIPFYVLLALLFMLVPIHFLLSSTTVTGLVLDRVLPKLNAKLNTDIRVGSLSVSLLPMHVSITDAVFTGTDKRFEQQFAGAESIEIDVSLLALFGGSIYIPRVEVDGGWNYLYIADGLENLPKFPKSNKPKKKKERKGISFPLAVDTLSLSNTRFALDMPKIDLHVEADDVSGTLFCDMDLLRTAGGDIDIGSVDFRIRQINEHMDRVEVSGAQFSFRDFAAEVDKLKLVGPEVTATAEGRIWDLLEQRTRGIGMDFTATVDADSSAVNRLFVAEPRLAGGVRAEAHLTGRIPDLKIAGRVWSDRLAVNRLDVTSLEADYDMDMAHVTVPSFALAVAGGRVAGLSEVHWKDGVRLSAEVDLSQVDVARALSGYGIKGVGARGRLGGSVQMTYEIRERGPLSATADLVVRRGGYSTPSGTIVLDGVDLSVATEATLVGKTVSIARAEVLAANSSVEFDGTLTIGDAIDGTVRFNSHDLRDFSPLMGQTLAGKLAVAGKLSGPLAEPTVDAIVVGDELEVVGRSIGELRAEVGLASGVAELRGLTVTQGETSVIARGQRRGRRRPRAEPGPALRPRAAGGPGPLDRPRPGHPRRVRPGRPPVGAARNVRRRRRPDGPRGGLLRGVGGPDRAEDRRAAGRAGDRAGGHSQGDRRGDRRGRGGAVRQHDRPDDRQPQPGAGRHRSRGRGLPAGGVDGPDRRRQRRAVQSARAPDRRDGQHHVPRDRLRRRHRPGVDGRRADHRRAGGVRRRAVRRREPGPERPPRPDDGAGLYEVRPGRGRRLHARPQGDDRRAGTARPR